MKLHRLPNLVERWWPTVLAAFFLGGIVAGGAVWVWSVGQFVHAQAKVNDALWRVVDNQKVMIDWATNVSRAIGLPEPKMELPERVTVSPLPPPSMFGDAYAGEGQRR